MRQVTHALLTRPPLSHIIFIPEGNPLICFVRLACVKHAASVHPEPGSNSQIKMFDSFKIISLANYPCFVSSLFKERLFKVCSLKYSLRIFKVVLLFNYQGSLLSRFLAKQPIHFNILKKHCQYIF